MGYQSDALVGELKFQVKALEAENRRLKLALSRVGSIIDGVRAYADAEGDVSVADDEMVVAGVEQ